MNGTRLFWMAATDQPRSTLPAATTDGTRTRDLCAYPRVSRYKGYGDPAVASSYRCTRR